VAGIKVKIVNIKMFFQKLGFEGKKRKMQRW
jgi:hypothetical protein